MMNGATGLFDFLARSADRSPQHIAVEEAEGGSITYRGIVDLASDLRSWLQSMDVVAGDRVGMCLHKSIDGVATIFGILKNGSAYVPLDPLAPAARNAYILNDCQVKAIVVERCFVQALRTELEKLGSVPKILILDKVGVGNALRSALENESTSAIKRVTTDEASAVVQPNDLAYLLYTSGSTGLPKGVMLSHENAMCFVDWCSDVFQPTSADRFSSHAPFHFDLSILDLYVPLKHGATLVLFGEDLGKEPARLAQQIAATRITHWYSAPSILAMLLQQGRIDTHDYSALRMVLFAGEVFPVKHLRGLQSLWPAPRYFNLYGPTETNVCTWYEIPREIPADRTDAYPIGEVCAHYRDRVIDVDGHPVPPGVEGELCMAGPGVMRGYWNLLEQNARVFFEDAHGTRWYRTGDVVLREPDGNFRFLGRRDRMIKKRGYRIELGEIEAVLYRHASVKEAAVIANSDDDITRIRAFLSTKDGQRISIIALKQFCAERLPLYMIPDTFSFMEVLPKTSTDKIAYQVLKEQS